MKVEEYSANESIDSYFEQDFRSLNPLRSFVIYIDNVASNINPYPANVENMVSF